MTPPVSYPLLTQELMLAAVVDDEVVTALIAAMPHADRLEAALDVCQYEYGPPLENADNRCGRPSKVHTGPWHPFVPLVTP